MNEFYKGMIESLGKARFFGSLELKFEAGNIVYARKQEVIKPVINPIDSRTTRSDALHHGDAPNGAHV